MKTNTKTKTKRTKAASLTALLMVGPPKESMEAARDSILAVLATAAGDAVKIAAIDAIKASTSVQNVVVSNCNFENNP